MWRRSGTILGYRERNDGLHWRVRDADNVILLQGVNGGSVTTDALTGQYWLIGWSRAQAAR